MHKGYLQTSTMTTLANDNAFTVAANILLEAQRARYGKAPCRPRPARKHSNDDSIADSGFYSSSETSSASSIAGEPCRATQEMVRTLSFPSFCALKFFQAHLSEALLRFYLDRAILSGDPPQDLAAMFGEEMLGSNVLDTFITSIGIATANPWDLGHRVATHVLQIFSKETLVGNCGLETDVEVYLCLIVSHMTTPFLHKPYPRSSFQSQHHRVNPALILKELANLVGSMMEKFRRTFETLKVSSLATYNSHLHPLPSNTHDFSQNIYAHEVEHLQ